MSTNSANQNFPYTQLMDLNAKSLEKLRLDPQAEIDAVVDNNHVTIRFGISNYRSNLSKHYQVPVLRCAEFQHFGLMIAFRDATELGLHDASMCLPRRIRELVKEFGPLILHNVFLPDGIATVGHRNRFPHLNFHRDRNESQPTPYSLFYRDPFDAEQQFPRTSSTLFVSNQHARMELARTGQNLDQDEDLSHCMLFTEFDSLELRQTHMGRFILEQRWEYPKSTGEVCILDNRQIMHASYYRNPQKDGYRIGVRYLM